jgi:hypothetical protein
MRRAKNLRNPRGAKEGSSAFLKKARKKLLLVWTVLVKAPGTRIDKSFSLLFFKKEALSCPPSRSQTALCVGRASMYVSARHEPRYPTY